MEKSELRNQVVLDCFIKSKHALSSAEVQKETCMSRAAVSCAIEYLKGANKIELYRVVGSSILYHITKQVIKDAKE